MESIKKTLQIVKPTTSPVSEQPQNLPTYKCGECEDRGWIFTPQDPIDGKPQKFLSQQCECRLRIILEKRLSVIPGRYSGVSLENLKPDIKKHKSQGQVIDKIKECPQENYGLCGNFGVGKTHFFWALYDHAARTQDKVWAGTLDDLLQDYTKVFRASQENFVHIPAIPIERLKDNAEKYRIFVDDIDKIKPTEYAAVQTFDLLDAIQSYGHQLVWTSNLNVQRLAQFFDRVDDRFGGAIARRLIDNVNLFEMF